MPRYETVIFDLDGTLLDTLGDLCDSTNFALTEFGYPERSIDEVRAFVGNGIGKLIERALPRGLMNPDYAKVLDAFKAHYAENCNNKTCAYEGVLPLLARLKAENVKLAVVSNKVDSAVKVLCKRYFPKYIQIAIGERQGISRKPSPDSVFAAIEMLGAKKESTVYIGDSEVDVETAKNAGVDLVAVSWGFRDRELLASLGDFAIADPAEEVLKLLI